ncbi:MAG: hypothetical protein H6613_19600 [Ignavibacteriales bacterium]|nr:hypothetical protein [Ignavibacteriales bacterium]
MQLIQEARERWNERLTYAYNHLGRIKSSNADLDLFYKRGILSLLTCEWNKKELLLQPYFSESGIDGGAVCSYLWGYAYVSKIMPIYNSQAWKNQIIQGIKTDAKNHYAFTPIIGEGLALGILIINIQLFVQYMTMSSYPVTVHFFLKK